MSDTSLAPSPSNPEPELAAPPVSEWARWAVLVLSVVSASALWLSWNTQRKVQSLQLELVRRQQDSQSQATEARLLARQAQDTARDAAARSTLLESRLAEVVMQRSQVEDLIKSMSLSRDENLLVDIEAAVRVAIQQTSLTGSAEPLVTALQSAEERLARARQPRLDGVRRAVAKDLDRLRATRVADLSSLAIRLDEAIRLVDELPLISQAGPGGAKANAPAASAPAAPVLHGRKGKDSKAASLTAAAASAPPQAASQPLGAQLLQWGSTSARTFWDEAQALVRITRIKQPEAVLVAPEQAFFLRENLKLRLLNARLALLSRQSASAVADLAVAQAAIGKYFDTQSRKTQLLQGLLTDVAAQSPQSAVPRPDDTLAALTAVSGGR